MLSIPYINVKSLAGGTQSLGNCLPYVAVWSFSTCCVPVHVLSLTRSVIITCRIKYLKHNKNADFIISIIFVIYLDKSWCNILFIQKKILLRDMKYYFNHILQTTFLNHTHFLVITYNCKKTTKMQFIWFQ